MAWTSAGAAGATSPPASRNIVLVGNPNVGKSVIFGLLTGRYVTVSNYPGTTVEVSRGNASTAGGRTAVTDTPGINSLIPQSEEEQVTRDILLREEGVIVQVGDEKNLPRTLLLALQVAETGRPFLLCLNMADEAKDRGIKVDTGALSSRLGVKVLKTAAIRRKGVEEILPSTAQASTTPNLVSYDARIEEAIGEIEPLLPQAGISKRSLALMLIAGDATLASWIHENLPEHDVARIEETRLRLSRAFPRSLAYVISEQRLRVARRLAKEVTRIRPGRGGRVAEILGTAAMHPIWGVPFLALVLWLVFLFVGQLGAGTGVDLLESGLFGKVLATLRLAPSPEGGLEASGESPVHERRLRLLSGRGSNDPDALDLALEERTGAPGGAAPPSWEPVSGETLQVYAGDPMRPVTGAASEIAPGVYRVRIPRDRGAVEVRNWTGWINPALFRLSRTYSPWEWLTDLFVGTYGLITMGLTYAIAIILPIIITFFLAFSVLEDSGYLPRLAIMVNRVFRLVGLNGKAVLPMVLGLGCDTMATLTTRILDSRKERLIAILLLALGVPCSAQLGVILGMLAGLSWLATAVWIVAVAGVLLLVGWLASRLIPGRNSDFILEVPPLRMPGFGNILSKTLARVEWYLKEAVPLFLLGTALLFVADRTGALSSVEAAVEPLVVGVLGLPSAASEAFIIGFLRRDFGSAGLFRLAEQGLLSPVQIVVSLVTMTLFIPCIANLLMIVKERGSRVALMVAGFIFPFAILVGGTLNFLLRALKVPL
jgi:ferrous iron transport protein B